MYHVVMGRVVLMLIEVRSQILLVCAFSSTLHTRVSVAKAWSFPRSTPIPDSGCSVVQDRKGPAGELKTYCGATEAVQLQGFGPGAVLAHATP